MSAMSREKTYNFAPGPSVLPDSVLERARDEMLDYAGSGMSVMEMSHRSELFQSIADGAEEKLRSLLCVPDTHAILFLQGGATLQFASIPMNLMDGGVADYAVTGHFSGKAAKEAAKYGTVHIAADTTSTGHDRIPAQSELQLTPGAKYFYYCANNTVFGTEWQYTPAADAPLAADMSSDILTRPVDFSKYALVYAGAQKNMAPAGLTVVMVDKALAGRENVCTPQVMGYETLIQNGSMLNTPPCWCIYMLSLVLDWVKENGGIAGMEELKKERSALIYDVLDNSSFYKPHVPWENRGSRSYMNVIFRTPSKELDARFVAESTERGLLNLKGHKLTGGLRASLYNAMTVEGAKALAEFMKEFETKNG